MKLYWVSIIGLVIVVGYYLFPRYHSQSLTGTWTGTYTYEQERDEQDVIFKMTLQQSGENLNGTVIEPNTFGEAEVLDGSSKPPRKIEVTHLTATLQEGIVLGKKIQFLKKYNGEGRVSHTVIYRGVISKNGNSIDGRWTIGKYSGKFWMRRDQ